MEPFYTVQTISTSRLRGVSYPTKCVWMGIALAIITTSAALLSFHVSQKTPLFIVGVTLLPFGAIFLAIALLLTRRHSLKQNDLVEEPQKKLVDLRKAIEVERSILKKMLQATDGITKLLRAEREEAIAPYLEEAKELDCHRSEIRKQIQQLQEDEVIELRREEAELKKRECSLLRKVEGIIEEYRGRREEEFIALRRVTNQCEHRIMELNREIKSLV